MDRPTSEYAQSDQTSVSTAAAPHYPHTPQPEARPNPQYSHTPQPEARPANISSSNTPQPEYALNPPPTRSPAYHQDYLPRPPPSFAPNTQPGGAPGMAQATNPSLPANSPTYPPPYSPYQPQGHEMAQYQGHPPPPHQMYARPEWGHGYGQQHHGLPGPYASPAATTVYSFVPIPGAQQHKRPRRRYEEIERMYKCGWNGCEKAYGTLNHLNAHVTMQSHGAKRTPEEFKEIRKEWKARKKEEESQRKAAEERERAAAQAAQAGQVDAPGSSDPSQGGPPSGYGNGVRPQLPPIGYQPADGQVQSQYGGPSNGMVYQSNGQMGYPPNYPHSPYQSGPVYQQRE
ncbi:Zinc finger C2H2 type domain-containing protein [Penicillium ucsense]|uniref:Zinc finger C2H2 type domain-containing protein n=1 Tax=Penicillium ucsense TaxID=2839758 RepID=A0A8J8WHY1_9EURO|nr:Zinc finger C2H2 type domain-containing protein [Penicillium ucsense]KAF7734334.1 Zinc finger C2H2 type domain-containing protein [Penicillium ucsense]